MKKPIPSRKSALTKLLALSLGLAGAAITSAQAQLYWDLDDGNVGGSLLTTASGTWTAAASTNWNVNSDGSGANTTWTNGSAAVFSAGTDVTGTSVVTVSGSVSTSGITVEEGTVNLAGTSTPSLIIGSGGITLSGSASLGASGAGLTSIRLSASQTWTNNSTGFINPSSSSAISGVDNTGAILLKLGGTNTAAVTTGLNGGSTLRMSISNGTGNTVSVEKIDAGSWTLSGSNSFTGGMTITAGTLNANSANALGAGLVTVNGGRLDLFSSGTTSPSSYAFNGGEVNARTGARTISDTVTVGGNFTLGGTGQGGNLITLSNTVDLTGGTRTITVDATGGAEISGAISNGGLTKAGTGVLTLSEANTYTGATTISAGTLRITSTGDLGADDVTLANSSGVVLTLENTASIADSAILNFGGSNVAVNLNFTGTDTLAGITGNSFTIGVGTYTAGELNDFFDNGSIDSSGGLAVFSGAGNLNVVPEPNTFAMILGGVGMLIGFQRARRRSRIG